MAARLGGHPGATRLDPEIERALAQVSSGGRRGGRRGSLGRGPRRPDPMRRMVRRILRRLDGMGKYGGYHTEFRHLARGFAGHERSLALEAGEALIRTGLLDEKPSVGQRHVALVSARTAEIRRLVEEGTTGRPELDDLLRSPR